LTRAARLLRPDQEGLAWLAGALETGGVVAIPTDTVYGLAAHPAHPEALATLFALKHRPSQVPVPVLIGHTDQIGEVAGRLGRAAARLARHHWPGPLTLVVPRGGGFGPDLGGPRSAGRTVGIRWPDHALVESLCRRVGPLAVTSANLHGAPPATSATQVIEMFGVDNRLGAVLDGGVCDGVPSTVIECRGSSARCLREGALPWGELARIPVGSEAEDTGSDGIRWRTEPGRG
jgi:tRNA threonylcarbamoyl adenosine modification protein (Sua5/YciO/YrdC/YwlC family)